MEEQSINIMDILNVFLKRWWIILISGIVIGLFSYIYSAYLLDPIYTSSGMLYVVSDAAAANNNASGNIRNYSSGDYALSVKLVSTYSEILKSNTFCQSISKRLDGKVSASQVKSMVSLSGVGETEILSVSANSKSPELAREVVQEILNNAPAEIVRVINAGSVSIIDNANLPVSPTSPNIPRNTLLGCLVGFLLAAALVFVVALFDTTVKDEEELTTKYNLPVLGVIPDLAE